MYLRRAKLPFTPYAMVSSAIAHYNFHIEVTMYKALILTLLCSISALPAAASTTLAYQGTDLRFGYFSQNDTNGGGQYAVAYDNFTLNGDYKVTWMQWEGSYDNPQQPGPITGWTVTFYTDNGGMPGTSCCSFHVNGDANESFLGLDAVGGPTFSYTLDLGDGICCFLNGVEYWLSVVPDLGAPPQWAWETSSMGDGMSYQVFNNVGGLRHDDLAFWLVGEPCDSTPEPGTVVLFGSSLLGAGGMLRRRLTS